MHTAMSSSVFAPTSGEAVVSDEFGKALGEAVLRGAVWPKGGVHRPKAEPHHEPGGRSGRS